LHYYVFFKLKIFLTKIPSWNKTNIYKLNNFMLSFRWTIFFGENLMITWRNRHAKTPAKNTAWLKITDQCYLTYPEPGPYKWNYVRIWPLVEVNKGNVARAELTCFGSLGCTCYGGPFTPFCILKIILDSASTFECYIYASLIVVIVRMNCGWDWNKLINNNTKIRKLAFWFTGGWRECIRRCV